MTSALSTTHEALLDRFFESGMIRFWPRDNPKGWILHSKRWSPFYIDCRNICSQDDAARILREIGSAFSELLKEKIPSATIVVGVATAGIPLGIATTMTSGVRSAFTSAFDDLRTAAETDEYMKRHMDNPLVRGELRDDDCVVLIDDLVTTGDSKLIAKKLVLEAAKRRGLRNVRCQDIAVIFDRRQGGDDSLERNELRLHALIPFRTSGLDWLRGRVEADVLSVVESYLKDPEPFQDETYRERLGSALAL